MMKHDARSVIIHIVNRDDKFAAAYINFMTNQITECKHHFITLALGNNLDLYADTEITYVNSYRDLFYSRNLKLAIHDCDKLIITGVFGAERHLALFGNSVWKKTYLHFWGGDFYRYRENRMSIKRKIAKYTLSLALKRCAGIINLVENDYNEIVVAFKVEKPHFVAQMPYDPLKMPDYSKYRGKESIDTGKNIRVLLGNSATVENQHLQAFKILSKFKTLEVLCPLSYGDDEYKAQIIEYGKEILGNRFIPVTEYMNSADYIKMLSECTIGVFNNNRQQAMGNINIMLSIGKKIYMRSDTSMWKQYQENGLILHDIKEISEETFESFVSVDNNEIEQNYNAIDVACGFEKAKNQWMKVIEN